MPACARPALYEIFLEEGDSAEVMPAQRSANVAEFGPTCGRRATLMVDHRIDMHIIHVHVQVKPGCEEAFIEASLANARNSVQEPGIARFDLLRDASDPTRFVLLEVYREVEAHARHRDTAHYTTWRDTVADMMAGPRTAVKYQNIFPDDGGW